MSFPDLLRRFERHGDTFQLESIAGWMQGRTLYGGATSLLGYAAVTRLFTDLPPLRSAQVDFIAPVSGPLVATARILRRGRNVAQVESRIAVEGALAHRVTWIFGAEAEQPNAVHPAPTADVGAGPDGATLAEPGPEWPEFVRQLETRRVNTGRDTIGVRRWIRLLDRDGLDPIAELVGIGDALPPGSSKAMQRPGPLSSISWAFNVVTPEPRTVDGWWLLESASDFADHGYSGERLRLWNSHGELMLSGLQSVAIFG